MKKTLYTEGDWFGVPLSGGGYAVGLIARKKKGRGSKVLFGYFFGQSYQRFPVLDEVKSLSPVDAVLVCKFGDLGLHDGSWKVIGHTDDWVRSDWPMPPFVRVQLISNVGYKVIYDENDPNVMLSEEKCDPSEAENYPRDSVLGSAAVEAVLTEKLKS